MSWHHSSRNSAVTQQWWDGMPVERWPRPYHWLGWWCQQTLHRWECPRQMPSSVFLYSPGNSWEHASYPGEVWRSSSTEARSIGLGMQSDTVGGRLHPKTIESPLDIHKGSYYSVGASRRWVYHWSEHDQCLGLLSRANQSCWALKPAHSTGLSFMWTCDSHAASRCWLNMTAAHWSCDWKQRWVHLKWPENDRNIGNI